MNIKNRDSFNDFFLYNEELVDDIMFELDSINLKIEILAKIILAADYSERKQLYTKYFK